MSEMSPLDSKAARAIAILMDRRASWAVTTYGDLETRIGHPKYAMKDILSRVAAWCVGKQKHTLALLVIEESGRPDTGLFNTLAGRSSTIDTSNYENVRVKLWREHWDGIAPPPAEEVAQP